jgi:hypothetical protein
LSGGLWSAAFFIGAAAGLRLSFEKREAVMMVGNW